MTRFSSKRLRTLEVKALLPQLQLVRVAPPSTPAKNLRPARATA